MTESNINHPFTLLNWDYHILRMYHKDAPSEYSVVSDMEDGEAIALNESIMGHRGTGEPDAEGFRDQSAYMSDRRALETWLREKAEAAGVRIDKDHPVYFAFEADPGDVLEHFKGQEEEMRLLHFQARDIDLSNWSFTIGDHFFGNYHMDDAGEPSMGEIPPHPLHGQVLNVHQLIDALREHGYPEERGHKIEAQMWATAPTFTSDRTLKIEGAQPAAEIEPNA